MRKIEPLPEKVHSSLRSSIVLFDLTRVVEELIFNSLDAGATKVSVSVGVATCYVKVVDDGFGVTRDGLVLLGERYVTSKICHLADIDGNTRSFGFRGEALSSISDIALLEMTSKTHGKANGYRKIIKGCKCLYFGIDDDRKDVGTTVIVRDLFYNQPVRRKHMQSSPEKVLYSVKKCVLRIALVHPTVSLKVVDIESEDQLLSTSPSSSTLSLLICNFGIEASSSLHEINLSNGVLKLSGYVSGPSDGISMKAFQYVYINSRFISKGPIHKQMTQLASISNENNGSGSRSGKRSRSHAHPNYIINLCCPQSWYELIFEPSKTSVKFKDWVPVLKFIKESVARFWIENRLFGESFSHAVDSSEEDEMWKEDCLENAEKTKKKSRIQNDQTSFGLPSSALSEETCSALTEETGNLSSRRKHSNTGEFNPKTKLGSSNHSDFSSEWWDDSLFKHISRGKPNKADHLWEQSDQDVFPEENSSFLENTFTTMERSNDVVGDYIFGPRWVDKFVKTNANMKFNESSRISLSRDSLQFDDDRSMDDEKPFLLSRCSIRPYGALSKDDDDGSEFQIGFRTKERRLNPDERVDAFAVDGGCYQNSELFPSNSSFAMKCNADTNAASFSRNFAKPFSINMGCFAEENKACDFILEDADEEGHASSFPSSLGQNNVNSSSLKYAALEFSVNSAGHILDDIFFPRCPSILTDKTDWLSLDTAYEEVNGDNSLGLPHCCATTVIAKDERYGRNQSKYQGYEQKCVQNERSRRAHSAPPFCRGRTKFVTLTGGAKKVLNFASTNYGAPTPPETVELTHSRQSHRSHDSSRPSYVEDSLVYDGLDTKMNLNIKPNMDQNEIEELKKAQQIYIRVAGSAIEETRDSTNSGIKWRNGCPQIANRDEPHNFHDQGNILDIYSGILHLASDSLVPHSISKKCLENAQVLQQVDKKFIPVVAGGTLAIIDQHAADERIRLEELRQKVFSGEEKTITYLDEEKELVLPEIGYQLLHNYADQILNWGWMCNIHAQAGTKSFTKTLSLLHRQSSVITLVAVPCILGVNLTDLDLLEFLQQLSDTDGSSMIPPSVHRVLNFKACRGAIMFGDSLLPSECSLVVEELKHTSLCFQCAHGRPTTAPLVNLNALHKQIAMLGDSSKAEWQGLRRHRITLERANQRLKLAQ